MLHRCTICGCVNDRNLALIPEQFYAGPYFDDPVLEHGKICQPCLNHITEDLNDDWESEALIRSYVNGENEDD
jgi:hypothetical protein